MLIRCLPQLTSNHFKCWGFVLPLTELCSQHAVLSLALQNTQEVEYCKNFLLAAVRGVLTSAENGVRVTSYSQRQTLCFSSTVFPNK